MNQFENMEVFVASEDAVEQIGSTAEVEVWTYPGGAGDLILRGFNASRDDLLQAENECLRKDVEFYKNRSTVERTVEVERQLEMREDEFEELLADWEDGIYSPIGVAERLKIALVKPEPTEADRIQDLINAWNKQTSFKPLSQHLVDHGLTFD